MPLYNSIGEPLPLLKHKESEKEKLRFISQLRYPEDEEVIFHLSPKDFRVWIYSQPPHKLFTFAYLYGIERKFELQAKPTLRKLITDFIWRLCH